MSETGEPEEHKHSDKGASLLKSLFGSDDEDEEEEPSSPQREVSGETPSPQVTVRPSPPPPTSSGSAAATTPLPTERREPVTTTQRATPRTRGEPLQELRVNIDKIDHIPKDAKVYLVRLSNVLSFQPVVFDPATYDGKDIQPEVYVDESGKERIITKPQDVVRWRHGVTPEGDIVKQSNAKLVKWSDGSMHLFIGKEPIKVVKEELKQPHQLLSYQPDAMQSEVPITARFNFAHETLDAIRDRIRRANTSSKRQTKMAAVTVDPEKEKRDKERMEEEKLRISERYEQKLRRKAPLRVVSTQQMVNYLEDDEDDDVLATKARAKQRRSLDSLEAEEERASRLLAAKEDSQRQSKRQKTASEEEDADDMMDIESGDI